MPPMLASEDLRWNLCSHDDSARQNITTAITQNRQKWRMVALINQTNKTGILYVS